MLRANCSAKPGRAFWMSRSTSGTAIPAISPNCSEEKRAFPHAIIGASVERQLGGPCPLTHEQWSPAPSKFAAKSEQLKQAGVRQQHQCGVRWSHENETRKRIEKTVYRHV